MKDFLVSEIQKDPWMMEILKAVRDLNLADCYIGAGFLRNKAWDLLHSYNERTALNDIDVVFFDKVNCCANFEKEIEKKLNTQFEKINFEVINQARTHLWHDKEAYTSTYEAISDWVETATCVAIRMNENEELEIIAPYGLSDIENLILRPIPHLRDLEIFNNRVKSKEWLRKWPKLTIAPISQ